MTSSERLTLDARELDWLVHFLCQVVPKEKREQDVLLRLVQKLENEHSRIKNQP
jgi:hypothetical protein